MNDYIFLMHNDSFDHGRDEDLGTVHCKAAKEWKL